jgi:hypothetical protein
MAENTNTDAGMGISGNAPLYVRPEPLNPELHGGLGVDMRQNPYGFAAKQHFVPLVAGEFPQACTVYPIIFAGEELVPLAVMGLAEDENFFFHEAGDAQPYIYVPAYIRRYPFTVAADQNSNQMIVCIDRESPLVTETGEARFFDGKELSEYGKNSVAFCESYERERATTQAFIAKLKELDLFEPREAKHTPTGPEGPGEPQIVASFFAISEDKLRALPADKFEEIRPLLGPVYAHLISMNNWDRLIAMALTRQAIAGGAVPAGKPN